MTLQSILKASQPRDLVVKPLAQLHNFISAYRLPADRDPLLPTSDAPTCRRILRTFSTYTLASKANRKNVVKFHRSILVRVSNCILLSLERTPRIAVGQTSRKARLPIPTDQGGKFLFPKQFERSVRFAGLVREFVISHSLKSVEFEFKGQQ